MTGTRRRLEAGLAGTLAPSGVTAAVPGTAASEDEGDIPAIETCVLSAAKSYQP
jgi:hypothetical protein